jgi:hypothetical protein
VGKSCAFSRDGAHYPAGATDWTGRAVPEYLQGSPGEEPGPMSGELDKRKSKRIAYPCEVELYGSKSDGSKGGRIDGKISVLSLRGAYIEAEQAQPVGTRLTLRFNLQTLVMTLTAEVAHSDSKGMGVHFLAMTRAQHQALEKLLADAPS